MTQQDLKREPAVPVILADESGTINYVNAAFEAAFGWSPAEIAGKPLTVICPKSLRDSYQLGFPRCLSTGRPTLLGRPLKLKTVDKTGLEFECEHTISAESAAGRWVLGATLVRTEPE